MNGIEDRLKEALERRGMTQRELAEKLGITEVSVSRYMSGDRTPKATILAEIAEILHVSIDYLATGKKTAKPARYIELIDKYRVEQHDGDYNPPSYIWDDNTGEVIRCADCEWYATDGGECRCRRTNRPADDDGFCAWAKKE